MRKRVIEILIFVLIIIGLTINVNAQNVDKVQKAYSCLDSLVGNTTLTLDEAIFASLANSRIVKAEEKIKSEKSATESCWPKAGCNVKTTAQVAIAYDHLGRDTKDITKWLLSKNGTISGFSWYLQVTIDNSEMSQCKINYDNADYPLSINNEMKLSGNLGSCLSIDPNGYRMRINNNCANKVFGVNCDKGFKINLLYEKNSGGTLYVSSRTESGSANSWKSLDISAKCFKEGNACNYEASLWATAALYSTNENYEAFVPYLSVLMEENPRLMPSAFLSYIEGGSQHYEKLIQSKFSRPQERAYWEVSGNRYYDTALGMMALGGCKDSGEEACTNPDLKDVANFLFDGQTEKGCWNNNNLKDTAFLLYAGWGETLIQSGVIGDGGGSVIIITGNETCTELEGTCRATCSISERTTDEGSCPVGEEFCCVPPYDPNSLPDCEVNNNYCVERGACLGDAGGELVSEYECSISNLVCCSQDYVEKTCLEQGGEICLDDEVCNNDIVDSSDGACCKDGCVKGETFECTENSECDEEAGEICEGGECIVPSEKGCLNDLECREGEKCDGGICTTGAGGSKTWIIILIVLIILIVIAIIFRNKIQMFLFKRKGKGKSGPVGPNGPGGPAGRFGFGGPMGRAPPRFGGGPGIRPAGPISRPIIRPSPVVSKPVVVSRPAPAKKMTEKEKDMEDTLKKLKKMAE